MITFAFRPLGKGLAIKAQVRMCLRSTVLEAAELCFRVDFRREDLSRIKWISREELELGMLGINQLKRVGMHRFLWSKLFTLTFAGRYHCCGYCRYQPVWF